MNEKIIKTVGCNNCGGRCVINAHVRDGKIIKITTERQSTVPDGTVPLTACARGMNYHKTFLGSDRLRYPMKRIGKRGEGRFERISWDEAIDIIASEWIRIRDTYGPGSRYVNYGWGQEALLRGNSLAERLLSLDGGYLGGYNSYSCACTTQATTLMYGTNLSGNSPETILDSKFVILWGHNPSETRFDCVTMYYLKKLKDKNVPIVVIDPRESDTIRALGAKWIPIRPATDPALMDAIEYVIYKNGLYDKTFLDKYCIGFDEEHMPSGIPYGESVASYLCGIKDGQEKTPAWAQKITGVPKETIEELAVSYATTKPSALIEGYGAQRNAYGEQISRGGILLACMTGSIGISGGSAAGQGSVNIHEKPTLLKVPNPYQGSIPVYRWTDAVEYGHEMTDLQGVKGMKRLDSDIKMIINLAGNCLINQHGDINRTAKILKDKSKCEFILCSDLFMTSSAKFADILLPGTSFFESNNIITPWKYNTFLAFANKAIEPLYESRFEYDWLTELAQRLKLKSEFTCGKTSDDWLEYCYNELKKKESELPEFETFKKDGIYRYKAGKPVLAFSDFINDPLKNPLLTPSGKIELFSKKIYETKYEDFMPAIPRYVTPPEGFDDPLSKKYPIQLVGWHTKRRCHSIHGNNKEMDKIDPQCVWMNPKDAKERNIFDKDRVIVFNDRGQLSLPVHITNRIIKGVAAISLGAWYSPNSEGVDIGGCINVLTSLRPTPYARGNAQHTNLVEIRKI